METLFIELLQVALGTRDKLSRVPSMREWEGLYDLAEEQAIVGLLLSGLESLPLVQLPPLEVKLQWIGIVQMMEAEYRLHCERAVELTRRFRTVGFKSCVLKGIGFSQYYPEPSKRQCGDIDLWVDGRRKDILQYLRSEYDVGEVKWHHVDLQAFDDVPVEVHIHPGWMYNPFCNRRLQQWFECEKDAQVVVNEKLGFACATASFDAVFSLVHSFHHLLDEGVGIRHIVDYYYIVRTLSPEQKKETVGLLQRFGLLKYACATMWVLKEVCGFAEEDLLCKANEKEGRFLLDEIMRGGNFGHYRNDNRQRNTLGRYKAVLPHYPREVLWMVPWKCWHLCWRALNSL